MNPHHEQRAKEALTHSITEIENLRRVNELLEIKAKGFDALAGIIRLLSPREGGMMSIDAVYIIRELLREIEAEEKPEAALHDLSENQ